VSTDGDSCWESGAIRSDVVIVDKLFPKWTLVLPLSDIYNALKFALLPLPVVFAAQVTGVGVDVNVLKSTNQLFSPNRTYFSQ